MEEQRSDVNVRAIARFGLGLLVLAMVIHVAIAGLFYGFKAAEERGDPAPSPVAGELPPEPRLQTAPRTNLGDHRARQENVLKSYGWVDRDAGTVRLPIDRAIELTAERGLPARKGEVR